jgi:hypothetical protein
VLQGPKKQSDFGFGMFPRRPSNKDRDKISGQLIDDNINDLFELVESELAPLDNYQIVQHHGQVEIKSVETYKEPFTLPINVGMYAWSKSIDIDNWEIRNINLYLV